MAAAGSSLVGIRRAGAPGRINKAGGGLTFKHLTVRIELLEFCTFFFRLKGTRFRNAGTGNGGNITAIYFDFLDRVRFSIVCSKSSRGGVVIQLVVVER